MQLAHIILVCSIFVLCRGDSIAKDFYLTLNVVEGEAGYRLFNGTHQFGFDSTVEDSRGVLVIVEDGDLSGLRECWQSRFEGYSGKFHMFMPVDMIDRSTVRVILESDCLAGIITYEAYNISTDKPLSHDAACPNSESGSDRLDTLMTPETRRVYEGGWIGALPGFSKDACVLNEWNEEGAILPEGLRNIDWKMQILYVHNQTYIDAIRKCHELYNTPPNGSTTVSFPFCSASFGVFSRGAGSSEICMRRTEHWSEYLAHATGSHSSLCGPLRGLNVIAHLPPKVHNGSAGLQSTTRYLMLTARLDGFGLIPEISPGEISVVTSVIALLAVVQAIGKNMDIFEQAALASNRHLLVAFFDGEAFDYIGSGSVAYDMMSGTFPRKPKNGLDERLELIFPSQLDGIIEVQQLGSGTGERLYAHAHGRQVTNGQVMDLLTALWAGVTAVDGILVPPTEYSSMPPSSWNSFAKINSSITGLVLAPFRVKYEYLRFNSMLDRAQWDSTQRSAAHSEVTMAASAMLRAAAEHVGLDSDTKSKLEIDKEFVSTLFKCFIDSADWYSCDYLNQITGKKPKDPLSYSGKSTYVKVGLSHRLRFPVRSLTMYLTGSIAHEHSDEKNHAACMLLGKGQNVYTYHVLTDPVTNTSHCYRTPVHFYIAESPAFDIEDYDFTNSTYSTWTEATYTTSDLQLFLIEDDSVETVMFMIGVAWCVLSFLLVYQCEEESMMTGESKEEGSERSEEEEPSE